MEYNSDIFSEQFPLVKRFLYHLTCYRELHQPYQDFNLESEFWTHTIDAHLLQATILWCMVFGSHGKTNPTHWKQLCEQNRSKLEDSFRRGLLEYTDITKEEWDSYWKLMKEFRDGYAAHRELSYSTTPIPNFKIAEEVAYFYDEWVRELIMPDIFEEPPLKDSSVLMQKGIRPMAMRYLSEIKLIKMGTEQD